MHNKAASTTLDTLKEILMDISEVCDRNLENNEASHGNQILCNMRDFMSDRAKTNLSLSKILVEYRMQIMPEVIDGWDNFDDEQKDAYFFLNRHGANNFLQKATFALCTSNVVVAECKVLPLMSKIVTGPLWRLIEENNHVLEMNFYYEMLLDFFNANSKDATSFINCETFPFGEHLINKDKYFDCLKVSNNLVDTLAVQVAQTLFLSFYKLLKVAMQQQLPGGLFYEPSPELTSETLSVLPHNKIPERAFGMLDFMVKYRPNASILTNEAFITFSFNQTNEWLDSLSEKERNELLQDARKKGRELRGKFKRQV
ncbi:unnamed protein product [Mytilus coruscus]|uniref:Uncharacterized protein n=1 Tax=Mytilus coruscus TaxID=42192 RepID=A0A6J8C1N2_MYTCO|nr:unnamed protein product [Mytilus coruscus]